MTRSALIQYEKKKIQKLAKEYKSKGYRIFVNLPHYHSPYPIKKFVPDMIVQKGNKKIIIEVKTKRSLKKRREAMECFALYARKRPKFRFDVFISNPRSSISKSNRK
ncbi:MAG: hypothetical protein ABSB18_06950 [Candidatus Omnitrophota bacterium]